MKIMVIDVDGVIHTCSNECQDGTHYDPPAPGAAYTLERLRWAGFEVVIYIARDKSQPGAVAAYLRKYGIPYDAIRVGRP